MFGRCLEQQPVRLVFKNDRVHVAALLYTGTAVAHVESARMRVGSARAKRCVRRCSHKIDRSDLCGRWDHCSQPNRWQHKGHHRILAAFELDAIPLQRRVPAVAFDMIKLAGRSRCAFILEHTRTHRMTSPSLPLSSGRSTNPTNRTISPTANLCCGAVSM